MLWNKLGKGITLQNLPWLSVLKEFKFLCPKGHRTKHNASRDRPQHSHPHLLTLDRLLVTRAFKQRSNSVQTAFKQWLGRKCLNSSNGIISQVLKHLSVQTVGMSVQTLEQRAWWCCWP